MQANTQLVDVRFGTVVASLADHDSDEVSEQSEEFYFAGYVEFDFKTSKGIDHPAVVKGFKGCTAGNIDYVKQLLPKDVWGDHVPADALQICAACPWGGEVVNELKPVTLAEITSGEFEGQPVRVRGPCSTHTPRLA